MSATQSCFERVEKKYILSYDQYEAMRRGMCGLVRPDEYRHYSIGNIYCDTADYSLIRISLEKPVYKEKLRLCSYGVPQNRAPVFVELKKKYEGIVYKRRVTVEAIEAAKCVRLKGSAAAIRSAGRSTVF